MKVRMCKMRYAKIRSMDISNGEGIGISLFVQGCHFHCKGCFNQETWDFDGGKEWTKDVRSKFIQLADKDFITRISILGGEPLEAQNVTEILSLIEELKQTYPNKKIWLYTGYTWDYIKKCTIETPLGLPLLRYNIFKNVDYVVEGLFDIKKQDLFNNEIVFAGSTNQKIIQTKDLDFKY